MVPISESLRASKTTRARTPVSQSSPSSFWSSLKLTPTRTSPPILRQVSVPGM